MHAHSYRNLAIELLIDFVIMYLVMFTMIATLDHFRFNLNNVYMTLMMVAPMAVVMLLSMRSMFQAALLETMNTARAPWRLAVSISIACSPKAPSPVTHTTWRPGWHSAAATA